MNTKRNDALCNVAGYIKNIYELKLLQTLTYLKSTPLRFNYLLSCTDRKFLKIFFINFRKMK